MAEAMLTVPSSPTRRLVSIPSRELLRCRPGRTLAIMTTQQLTRDSANTANVVDQYLGMWNEPDPSVRRETVTSIFTADAHHVVSAPIEMRETAYALGFPRLTLEIRGHADLEFRVGQAYAEFVGSGQYRFEPHGEARRVGQVVMFGWQMVATAGGDIAGTGTDVSCSMSPGGSSPTISSSIDDAVTGRRSSRRLW